MKTKIVFAIMATILMTLPIFSTASSGTQLVTSQANNVTPLSSATNYGNVMQYDWPVSGQNEGHTGFNSGPAPDKADVQWSTSITGSGVVNIFDGKAFVIDSKTVRAFDALTGASLYNSTATGTSNPSTVSGVQKLDDTYMLTYGVGFAEAGIGSLVVRKIATGEIVWTLNMPYDGPNPGSWHYFCGQYSESMKMYYAHAWDPDKLVASLIAYDLSNPSEQAKLAWTYLCDKPSEILCSGDGKVFAGTTGASVIAINGTTGERIWETSTGGGLVQQQAMYYNGKLYTSADTTQMTCFDGKTGQILWQDERGPRCFTAYRGAIGYGMVFEASVELEPHGYIRAWDVETGERLWMAPAYFNIAYITMAVADGKLYTCTCDQAAGIRTGGLAMPGYEFSCIDVYTGTVLWKLKNVNLAQPSIAYGNLYGVWGGKLWCIGGSAEDWTLGLEGNLANPRVAVGQTGPADISTPRWTFQTGGEVSSSPAVVDGKVYVGSEDKNWYCLNAYTGAKIWNFTVGHYIRSSVAVIDGKLYTGADDGYFYCLDANTGTQLWKTSAGGFFPNTFCAQEFQARSCPIVIDNKLYAGSLDGKVYCLSTTDGRVLNTFDTEWPIFGSPTYSDGTIYIVSTDYHLYALNAAGLSLKWSSIPLNDNVKIPSWSVLSAIGTPTVANGVVYVGAGVFVGEAMPGVNYTATGDSTPNAHMGGGMRMMAFNAATGASVWNITRAGNTLLHVPVYWKGQIYSTEFFYVTATNATSPTYGTAALGDFGGSAATPRLAGNRTWAAWVGYQSTSSVAYADDLTGAKIYVGSDIGSVYALDVTNGQTLSVYTAKGNVPSSPAIWEGKMYIGGCDGMVKCFDDSPVVSMSIQAESNKGATMWNNETIQIRGQLLSNPIKLEWVADETNPTQGVFKQVASEFRPAIPNATIQLYLTKPDGSDVSVTTTTDKAGNFEFSYNPAVVGTWGWVVNYEGEAKVAITYASANSEWNSVNVVAAPDGSSTTVAPATTTTAALTTTSTAAPATFGGDALTITYAVVGVIIVVIIAIAAYVYTKRTRTAKK
jgi:outer membrane protein assembly factor BamB